MKKQFVLASKSPRRLELLAQIGLAPSKTIPAEVDESPQKGELVADYTMRIASEKCTKVWQENKAIVLAADTSVSLGRRILQQAGDEAEAEKFLKLLSGRRHKVTTSVVVMDENGKTSKRTVETAVKFKVLSKDDITAYVKSGEWQGKAGGYAIQGFAGSFVTFLSGSYSNVVGLPLYETKNLLNGVGVI